MRRSMIVWGVLLLIKQGVIIGSEEAGMAGREQSVRYFIEWGKKIRPILKAFIG